MAMLLVGNTVYPLFKSIKFIDLGEISCLTKNRLFHIHLNDGKPVLPAFENRHGDPMIFSTQPEEKNESPKGHLKKIFSLFRTEIFRRFHTYHHFIYSDNHSLFFSARTGKKKEIEMKTLGAIKLRDESSKDNGDVTVKKLTHINTDAIF